ncbi:MAG: hypothetical protein ACOYXU_04095 [Nitrospirota bacterium]
MTMDAERFRECLLIHGVEIQQWPEDIRQAGLEAMARSLECRALQEECRQFEAILRMRAFEEPSPDLALRIVSAARRTEQRTPARITEFLAVCFQDLRLPAPVVTAAVVLIIGVVIGLLLPAESVLADSESAEVQTFLDSATEAL